MIPAVANGVPIMLTRPSDGATTALAIDPVVQPITFNGFYPAVAAPLTLGGKVTVATLMSMSTVNGIPVVLVGSTVTTSDGFTGVVGLEHGAGSAFNLQ